MPTDLPAFFLTAFGPLLGVVAGLATAVAAIVYLMADAAVEEEGPDRDRLIAWLDQNRPRAIYVLAVTYLLNRVDRFLGDAGRPELNWPPSPFGNRDPAPFWTAPSLDRCAVIGIVYSVLSVFLIWVLFGDAGRFGALIGLPQGEAAPGRLLALAQGCLPFLLTLFLVARADSLGLARFLPLLVLYVGIAVLGVMAQRHFYPELHNAVGGAGAVGAGLGVLLALRPSGLGMLAVAVLDSIGMAILIDLVAAPVTNDLLDIRLAATLPPVLAAAGTYFGIRALADLAARRGVFYRLWAVAYLGLLGLALLGIALLMTESEEAMGPMLVVFFGLVPLVNLPFDFVSVGLTRALLRRGCEPDAPSPVLLGLLDLLLACVTLVLLVAALIAAIMLVDRVALARHDGYLLDLGAILDTLREDPLRPAVLWIYPILLTTLIPSLLNIMIGMLSILGWSLAAPRRRMVAALRQVAARPEGWRGLGGTRIAILAGLAVQVWASIVIACGAFILLFEAVRSAYPVFLPALLDACGWFADAVGAVLGYPAATAG